MTLCIAWIRETPDSEELVFATDSVLTGGEKWNHGVKLFELPRTDCLLCFAGETYRAYPLILNLISTIKHNDELRNPSLDIQDVLYGIVDIFTELVNSIFDKPKGGDTHIGGEAKFLFGGWSWKESRFRIWRINYSTDAKAFLPVEETAIQKSRVCIFLGDPETEENNIAQKAEKSYKDLLIKLDKFDEKLDLEPLNVLVDMCRDKTIREVDGALQIGKVYKSGTTEFFGVMWQSVKGKPTFLGKIYDKYNKPRVRYFDPDACQIIEDAIPKSLVNIEEFNGSEDYEFLKSCYTQEDYFLKQELTEKERIRLISIFREYSYGQFLIVAEKNLQLATPDAEQNNAE
jgi:hypothetical protein